MIANIKHRITKLNPIDFGIQLTIFFILLHFSQSLSHAPLLYVPILILSSIGILFQDVRKSVAFWVIQTIGYFAWLIPNWQLIDNHKFLWGYWLIAITIHTIHQRKHNAIPLLPWAGQSLIAGCMVFAVLQKILSPDYLNGSFFYYAIITDPRFTFLGTLFNIDFASIITENIKHIHTLKTTSESVTLNGGPAKLTWVANTLTWYTIGIESLLAIVFLLPRKRVYHWQHWLLLTFSTLYFILPIKGFAFTLLTMGFVCLNINDTTLKNIYLGFYVYIFAIATLLKEWVF
jgi:hypothetical protein